MPYLHAHIHLKEQGEEELKKCCRSNLVALDDADGQHEGEGCQLDEALLAEVAVQENRLKGRPHSAALRSLALAPKALTVDNWAFRHGQPRSGQTGHGRQLDGTSHTDGYAHREGRGSRHAEAGECESRPHLGVGRSTETIYFCI